MHRFPDPTDPDHPATVRLGLGDATESHLDLASAIRQRRSDRRSFSTWRVPDHVLATICRAAEEQGAVFRTVTVANRTDVAGATAEAAWIQEASPAYVRELDRWTSGGFVPDDAVPAANLPRPAEPGRQARRKFAGTAREPADLGPPDGSVQALLTTASDDPVARPRAGEALSAALLMATALGVATCPCGGITGSSVSTMGAMPGADRAGWDAVSRTPTAAAAR